METAVTLQRAYYTRTALAYDQAHSQGDSEHDLACSLLEGLVRHYRMSSVLDVGSGTGRAVARLRTSLPDCRVLGIEPVAALRSVGHANGVPESHLIHGDVTKLEMPDRSYDLVCEFGVLHHVPDSRRAVSEMIRVADKAIFISDSNRFGQGGLVGRFAKVTIWQLGLWPLANWIKTKGRGYTYSEGDGVAYSYSVFDDYRFVARHFAQVVVCGLNGKGCNTRTSSSVVCLFAFGKRSSAPHRVP
jgi:SAM-dependent methyltransferase